MSFFKHLQKYREKEIPSMIPMYHKKQGFKNYKINLSHFFNNEDKVDIKEYGLSGDNYYYRRDNPPYYERISYSIPDLWLRKSVAEKFSVINERLNTIGLELYFFDCFRPVEVQNYFHDVWFPNYLKKIYPTLEGEKLVEKVEQYWSKGAKSAQEIDPNSPPPHSTGAVADLTIRNKKSRQLLWMGSIFDDVTESAHLDYLERKARKRNLTFTEIEALQNRRLLYWLLIEEGFVINPTEYWHASWGDQMWAKLTDSVEAYYSNLII